MASVEVEAGVVLIACKGFKTAVYAEVGGGALAPVAALLKPEYSELMQKVETIETLAQFAATYPAAEGKVFITDEDFRLIAKFFPPQPDYRIERILKS
jgi:hypothetical protein